MQDIQPGEIICLPEGTDLQHRTRLVYLASPYSDPDPAVCEERFQAACRAAAALIRQGVPVFSPIAHSHPVALHGGIDPLSPVWYQADMPLLKACTEMIVLMLPGWEKSRGIAAERAAMLALGRPVRGMTLTDIEGGAAGVIPLARDNMARLQQYEEAEQLAAVVDSCAEQLGVTEQVRAVGENPTIPTRTAQNRLMYSPEEAK